jgi:hypothetical protein
MALDHRNSLIAHRPRWRRMEKLAMLDIRVDDAAVPRGQPSSLSLAQAAEAVAIASWTTEPGLREEHVEALACPSPRGPTAAAAGAAGADAGKLQGAEGDMSPRIGASIRPQSRSDLTADEIVGGYTRPEQALTEADGAPSTQSQPDTVGRVESVVRKKDTRDLDRLVYCQRLAAHDGAVWAMRFSQDGRWLATGGQDTIVRIWRAQMWNETGDGTSDSQSEGGGLDLPSTSTSATRCDSPEPGGGQLDGDELAARRAFDPEPAFELRGHQHDVLDLAWSRDNFLLSSSMDTTVNLWHTSTSVCLRQYQHSDFVTAVMFNPADDTMFLTGSLSGQLSLWHIPSHRVVAHREIQESITSAALNPDGGMAVAGTFEGKATFFRLEVEGSGSEVSGATLGHLAQLDLSEKQTKKRGPRGRAGRAKSGGSKITGITFRPGLSVAGETALGYNCDEVLISSNDDR